MLQREKQRTHVQSVSFSPVTSLYSFIWLCFQSSTLSTIKWWISWVLAPQPKALEHNAQVNKIRKPLADLCWVPLPKPWNTSTCHPLASVQSWKPPLSAGLPPAEPNTACFLDTTGWSTQTQGSYHPTPTRATNVPVSAVSPCNISAPGRPRFPTLSTCSEWLWSTALWGVWLSGGKFQCFSRKTPSNVWEVQFNQQSSIRHMVLFQRRIAVFLHSTFSRIIKLFFCFFFFAWP